VILFFASDLHLDPARPESTSRCLDFLAREVPGADALYLLGDLFETWIGDDDPQAVARELAQALARLSAGGTAVFLLPGNRDFLLGPEFARDCGALLLPDPVLTTIHGRRVLLTHGDALCVDDRPYQRLRALVRDVDVQRSFLALDSERRRALAAEARAGSRAHVEASAAYLTDASRSAIEAAFRTTEAELMIHGHTHRPAIHAHDVDGQARVRVVLGDWHEHGTALRWDSRGYELVVCR
jgi:UDP-2,3-diacylglucosamine hydrolase